jgi:hypothetical protein
MRGVHSTYNKLNFVLRASPVGFWGTVDKKGFPVTSSKGKKRRILYPASAVEILHTRGGSDKLDTKKSDR